MKFQILFVSIFSLLIQAAAFADIHCELQRPDNGNRIQFDLKGSGSQYSAVLTRNGIASGRLAGLNCHFSSEKWLVFSCVPADLTSNYGGVVGTQRIEYRVDTNGKETQRSYGSIFMSSDEDEFAYEYFLPGDCVVK